MLRRIIRNVLKKFLKQKPKPILYKIGNTKHHNSLVDTLVPQLVEIGNNFVSAPNSVILAHDASLYMKFGVYKIGKTVIGNNVFLGANSVVLPGINIGDNAIIGAGAVVTKDVRNDMVVAGNPAREICSIYDYFKKCKEKDILINAPDSFQKIKNNDRLTEVDIQEFQNIAIIHKRSK